MLRSGGRWDWRARTTRRLSVRHICVRLLFIALLILNPHHARGADTLLVMGSGLGGNTMYAYLGRIKAFANDIDGTGFMTRFWVKAYKFDYKTNLTPATSTKITATGTGLVLEGGYQWKNDFVRLAGFVGLDFRIHTLRPNDPGSRLKDKLSPQLAIDGSFKLTDALGLDANASTSIAYRETWVQARPYYRLPSGLKFGPDLAIISGKDYMFGNIGLYSSGIKLEIATFGTLYLGVKAGLQHDRDKGRYGPYGGFHVSFFL